MKKNNSTKESARSSRRGPGFTFHAPRLAGANSGANYNPLAGGPGDVEAGLREVPARDVFNKKVTGPVVIKFKGKAIALTNAESVQGSSNATNDSEGDSLGGCCMVLFGILFAAVEVGMAAALTASVASQFDSQPKEMAVLAAVGMSILSIPSVFLAVLAAMASSISLPCAAVSLTAVHAGLFAGASALGSVVLESEIDPATAASAGALGAGVWGGLISGAIVIQRCLSANNLTC